MSDSDFKHAFDNLCADVEAAVIMENSISGRRTVKAENNCFTKRRIDESGVLSPLKPHEICHRALTRCKKLRRIAKENTVEEDLSDATLSRVAHFTDKFALQKYEPFLHYVPRLVNVVTVCGLR